MCSSSWSPNDQPDHKYAMNLIPNLWSVEQHAGAMNTNSNSLPSANGHSFPSPISTPSTMNTSISPANSNPSTTISSSTTTSVPSSPSAPPLPHLLNEYLIQKTSEINNNNHHHHHPHPHHHNQNNPNYNVFNTLPSNKHYQEYIPSLVQQQQNQQKQVHQQLPPELLQSFENLNLAALLQQNSHHIELNNHNLSTSDLNSNTNNNPQVILHYNVNVQYDKSINDTNSSIDMNNNGDSANSSNNLNKKNKKKGMKKNSKKNRVITDPLLYKTELCAQFERSNGSCPYGSKCQYAHGLEELQRVTKSSSFKTKDCENWIKFGSCRYGRRCCFRHGDETLAANVIVNDKKSKKRNQNGGIAGDDEDTNEANLVSPSAVIEQSILA